MSTTTNRPRRPSTSPDRSKRNGVESWLKSQISYYEKLIEAEREEHRQETPDVQEWLFRLITGLSIGTLLVLGAAIWLWLPDKATVGGIPINPQIFAYLFLIIYIIVSFRSVDVDEVAGADFFGTPVKQFERGLKWVPFIWLHFRKEFGTFVQCEFPGDADHIQWSDEKIALEEGKVRPIYALTGEDPDGKLPSDKQMNIGLSALAKFQVVKVRFFDFVINVGPIDAAKRFSVLTTMTGGGNVSDYTLEVVRHLRDTTTGVLREIMGQLSYNEITSHLHLINTLYWRRVEETVISWGIKMVEVRITNTNPGHGFNEELQKRSNAINERDALIIVAEGEKKQLMERGRGNASAEAALLKARAEGYAKVAKVAKAPEGQVAISADVAGKLASSGNTIVVGAADGLRDLIGMVATGKKVK